MERPRPKSRIKALFPPPRTVAEFHEAFRRPIQDFICQWWSHNGRIKWGGRIATKFAFDCWIYQELVYEIKPDVIVEFGSGRGGSCLFFLGLVENLSRDFGGERQLITIDRKGRWIQRYDHPQVTAICGSVANPKVIEQVHALCEGKRVFAVHDAWHQEDRVYVDLKNYADIISVGSYLVVEDTLMNIFHFRKNELVDHPKAHRDGPLLAVERFLREDDRFEIDYDCHKYFVTMAPFGFLKRVK